MRLVLLARHCNEIVDGFLKNVLLSCAVCSFLCNFHVCFALFMFSFFVLSTCLKSDKNNCDISLGGRENRLKEGKKEQKRNKENQRKTEDISWGKKENGEEERKKHTSKL